MALSKRPNVDPKVSGRAPAVSQLDGPQDIAMLKARYEELRDEKTRAEANLGSAKDQLDVLKQQARDTYGTDDLAALKQKLADMKAENERKRSEYEATLNQIDQNLAAVEAKHQQGLQEEGA